LETPQNQYFKKYVGPCLSISFVLIVSAGVSWAGVRAETEESPVEGQTHNRPDDSYLAGSNRCFDCHQFDPVFSHPVNVAPPASMNVPASLPLVNGKVTCITCHSDAHDDHSADRTRSDVGMGMEGTGLGLCSQCHDLNAFTSQEMHAGATRKAHLIQSNGSWGARQASGGAIPDWLDSGSDSCMSCHDGAMASGSGTEKMHIPGVNIIEFASTDHPIGPYRLTNPSEADGPLVPAFMLDDRIRLFDNHVGCNSCHSVYSPIKDLLVMSNENSSLCLGCHEY